MNKIYFRIDKELKGKELSANTIASFLAAQGEKSVPDLRAEGGMNYNLLDFLNRHSAMRYWMDNGWLVRGEHTCYLTEAGIDEVITREAGAAIGATGKKKPSNVSPQRVMAALHIIETGNASENEKVICKDFKL